MMAGGSDTARFLYDRKLRPIIQKRSARMRTRRKGRWLFQKRNLFFNYFLAITSTSIKAPLGSLATSTADLAG